MLICSIFINIQLEMFYNFAFVFSLTLGYLEEYCLISKYLELLKISYCYSFLIEFQWGERIYSVRCQSFEMY